MAHEVMGDEIWPRGKSPFAPSVRESINDMGERVKALDDIYERLVDVVKIVESSQRRVNFNAVIIGSSELTPNVFDYMWQRSWVDPATGEQVAYGTYETTGSGSPGMSEARNRAEQGNTADRGPYGSELTDDPVEPATITMLPIPNGTPVEISSCLTSDRKLSLWFTAENAIKVDCNDDGGGGEGGVGEDGFVPRVNVPQTQVVDSGGSGGAGA